MYASIQITLSKEMSRKKNHLSLLCANGLQKDTIRLCTTSILIIIETVMVRSC